MLDIQLVLKRLDVNVDKLCLIRNHEDECWEILERDGTEPDSNGDADALIAKFYWAPEFGKILIDTLRELKKSAKLKKSAPRK